MVESLFIIFCYIAVTSIFLILAVAVEKIDLHIKAKKQKKTEIQERRKQIAREVRNERNKLSTFTECIIYNPYDS